MKKTIVAAALVAAFPVFAIQPDAGWYLGYAAGQSQVRDAGSLQPDDRSIAGKVFVGYQLNRVLAVEAGYVHLGKFDADGSSGQVNFRGSSRVYGVFAEALGTIPLSRRFSLFGKAGVVGAKVKTSVSASDTDANPVVGFGAGFNLDRNFTVRVEGERFRKLGDKNVTGESDVDLISAALMWRY